MLRGADADAHALERLDANIAEAAALYRRIGGSFENELRALAGHREAIRHRLEAVRTPGTIEVPITVSMSDGRPVPLPSSQSNPKPWKMTAEQYFIGVPARFRDPDRFTVQRRIKVQWPASGREAAEAIKVFELETGALVWKQEAAHVPQPPLELRPR